MGTGNTMSVEAADAPPDRESQTTETARLEAFSDGVFAVAITLLALDLGVPAADSLKHYNNHLAGALLHNWPHYLAYLLSFLTILIMWVNHHSIFRFIRRSDHRFLLLNGLLLMVITTIPFATGLLAEYLQDYLQNHGPENWRVAQVVYSGISLMMALVYNYMWRYASTRGRLLDPEANQQLVQSVTKQFRFGPALYLIVFVLAFFSPVVSLALCILLALFYALPSTITRALST
jgi:uncharacterized membrane protein